MNINLIVTIFWLGLSGGVLIPGLWLLFDGKSKVKMIDFILHRFYLFGKMKNSNEKLFTDVPKACFRHFYIFGLLINIPLVIIYQTEIFLFSLFIVHMCRRLYECFFVHQYSTHAKMSFIHYVVGLIHYPCVGLTILVDHQSSSSTTTTIQNRLFGLILFLIGNYIQCQTHLTLSKLRQTSKEKEIYPIPHGFFLFEYISCPNYFGEILIYISLFCLSHKTSSFLSLIIWIFVNQILSGLFTHRWYCQKYQQIYPSTRRAILPFLF